MKVWLNCLSGNDPRTAGALGRLSKSPSVDLYSTVDERIVGKTLSYEIRDEIDLWAWCEIDDTATRFERSAGLLALQNNELVLMAVLVTNLTREQLMSLGPT